MGRRNATAFSPPLSPGFTWAFLEMEGFCHHLPNTARGSKEKFLIPSVAAIQLSLELNPKPSKKSFSISTIFCTPFLVTSAPCHGGARPSPGGGHMGCPDLEFSVSLPITPREAMPLVEEATPMFVLCSSCQGGGKGWSVSKVRPLTQPGCNHSVLLSPRGNSCCTFGVDRMVHSLAACAKNRLNLSNPHLPTSSALLSRL